MVVLSSLNYMMRPGPAKGRSKVPGTGYNATPHPKISDMNCPVKLSKPSPSNVVKGLTGTREDAPTLRIGKIDHNGQWGFIFY